MGFKNEKTKSNIFSIVIETTEQTKVLLLFLRKHDKTGKSSVFASVLLFEEEKYLWH